MNFEVATYSTDDGIEYVKENGPVMKFGSHVAASFCTMAIRNRGRIAHMFKGEAPIMFQAIGNVPLLVS